MIKQGRLDELLALYFSRSLKLFLEMTCLARTFTPELPNFSEEIQLYSFQIQNLSQNTDCLLASHQTCDKLSKKVHKLHRQFGTKNLNETQQNLLHKTEQNIINFRRISPNKKIIEKKFYQVMELKSNIAHCM